MNPTPLPFEEKPQTQGMGIRFGAQHSHAIVDLAEDAIISVGADFRIVLFNQGAERVFGYRAEEALGKPLDILLPPHLAEPHRGHIGEFANAPEVARRMGERREILGRRKSGEEFPAEASILKAEVDGARLYTAILRDVTERKRADQRIRTSLREKEALLKEIHHRVKNNLQVVSSLLGLQSRIIPSPDTRRMFEESQNRIHSMALLHESLYESDNLSEIDCNEYVGQLAAHLFRCYGVSASRISLALQIDDMRLSMDHAVPCGLILNELLSNSLKYAFPDGKRGEIRVELRKNAERLGSLTVADDGIGLPGDVSLWSSKSLGLRLVRMLAEQIGGIVDVESEEGTRVRLTFNAEATGHDAGPNLDR